MSIDSEILLDAIECGFNIVEGVLQIPVPDFIEFVKVFGLNAMHDSIIQEALMEVV